MSRLTKKDLLHVAKLANLNLSEAEIKKFLPQLVRVVDYISELKEVDTEGIEPTSQTTGLTNVFRNDVLNPQTVKVENHYSIKCILQKNE